MTNTAQIRNQLLRALQPEDLHRISGLLTRVPLRLRQMLHVGRMPRERVYFIESGLVSVSGARGRGQTVEAWLLGFEGTTAVPAILQDDEPSLQCVVQIGGEALEIGRVEFMAVMEACPGIRTLLLRYVNFTLLCAVQTGICNSNHSIEQRLARWLLFARDGFPDQSLPITHRALDRLLGVRRASVTLCLGALEQAVAITRRTRQRGDFRSGKAEPTGLRMCPLRPARIPAADQPDIRLRHNQRGYDRGLNLPAT